MAKIDKVWLVTDPTDVSVIEDVLYETNTTDLGYLIIGTGGAAWRASHPALYTDETEAREDARARLAARDAAKVRA